MNKEQAKEQALRMIRAIIYDNGMVNRWEPEYINESDIEKIAIKCKEFYMLYPNLLTEEDTENICCGEYGENQERYGKLAHYEGLSAILDEFFDNY